MPTYNTITERITLNGFNGDEIEAYVAKPSEPGSYPGVVVIHHLPGWDAWTREITRKFAEAGYAAIAPHLFSRWMPMDERELFRRAVQTWGPPDPQAIGDIAAAARYLKAQPSSNGKVGCIGFCSGGRQAYLAASQVAEVDAAVDCWGGAVIPGERFFVNEDRPISPFGATKAIHMPLLGIFGNDDDFPAPAEVDEIEAELKANGKDYEFHRYDGAGHGFWANFLIGGAYVPGGHRPKQAQDSWAKVCAFYERHLR